MSAILQHPEQKVVLDNISWSLYEDLLAAQRDRRAPRVTYDRGQLEIESPSAEHEQITEAVGLLVHIVAEESGVNVKSFGSTTFRREDIDRGFEPDVCFYVSSLSRVLGKAFLDLKFDPAPDLVIEVDIFSSSLDRLSIMARMGIAEVWRYEGGRWWILGLNRSQYEERHQSAVLPALTAEAIARFAEMSRTLEPLDWVREVREFVRKHRVQTP
jgi:Uma2 family endonuclease